MTESKEIAVQDGGAVSDPFLTFLRDMATSKDVDVTKMQAILDMKERQQNREAEQKFNRDYTLAKMEMPRVKKDGSVEYDDKDKKDGSKKKAFNFARYEDIDKAIRPTELKYGFSRIFTTGPRSEAGGGVIVYCTLLHKDGHSIKAEIPVALDTSGGKNNIQAMGSSFSYGKRYTTEMIWDIVKEGADDDGQSYDLFPIDDAQFEAIQELIAESQTDTAAFCKHLKVDSLRAISNKQYPKAIQDLKAKIEILKKKAVKNG